MGNTIENIHEAGPPRSRPSPIRSFHECGNFFCGHEPLDDWLKHTALKSEGRSVRTCVVCKDTVVVGYYCLATGSLKRDEVPSKLRRNVPEPVPAMVIGRLAVDKHHERQGIGGGLLCDALRRILQASEVVGCRAVVVHVIDQSACDFYEKYGFPPFPSGARTLFLPTETIANAIA